MQHNYSFESALAASSRVNWRVEDIIGGDKKLEAKAPAFCCAAGAKAVIDTKDRARIGFQPGMKRVKTMTG